MHKILKIIKLKMWLDFALCTKFNLLYLPIPFRKLYFTFLLTSFTGIYLFQICLDSFAKPKCILSNKEGFCYSSNYCLAAARIYNKTTFTWEGKTYTATHTWLPPNYNMYLFLRCWQFLFNFANASLFYFYDKKYKL